MGMFLASTPRVRRRRRPRFRRRRRRDAINTSSGSRRLSVKRERSRPHDAVTARPRRGGFQLDCVSSDIVYRADATISVYAPHGVARGWRGMEAAASAARCRRPRRQFPSSRGRIPLIAPPRRPPVTPADGNKTGDLNTQESAWMLGRGSRLQERPTRYVCVVKYLKIGSLTVLRCLAAFQFYFINDKKCVCNVVPGVLSCGSTGEGDPP